MGCAASADASIQKKGPVSYKLLVLDWEDHITDGSDTEVIKETRIDVYSLKRFRYLSSVHICNDFAGRDMFLCGDFSVTCHREEPYMVVTGGLWTDDEGATKPSKAAWKVDLSQDMHVVTKYTDLPEACQGHMSCICSAGHESYLYVFTTNNFTYCLNLDTNTWDILQNIPLEVCDIKQIATCNDMVACISTKYDLYLYKAPQDYTEDWEEVFCQPLPVGLFCEVDGFLYSLSGEDNALFKTNLKTGEFSRVNDIDDLDVRTLQKSTSMTGCGERLFFTGHHYSSDTKSLIEVDLRKKRSLVAGYLNDNSDSHEIMACQVPL